MTRLFILTLIFLISCAEPVLDEELKPEDTVQAVVFTESLNLIAFTGDSVSKDLSAAYKISNQYYFFHHLIEYPSDYYEKEYLEQLFNHSYSSKGNPTAIFKADSVPKITECDTLKLIINNKIEVLN